MSAVEGCQLSGVPLYLSPVCSFLDFLLGPLTNKYTVMHTIHKVCVLAPGALVSFNVTCLIECHPQSPTSNSVVDYILIYLEEKKHKLKRVDVMVPCLPYQIRRRGYYLLCCSFCVATIRGQRLFLWKAWRHQQWLDRVRLQYE